MLADLDLLRAASPGTSLSCGENNVFSLRYMIGGTVDSKLLPTSLALAVAYLPFVCVCEGIVVMHASAK